MSLFARIARVIIAVLIIALCLLSVIGSVRGIALLIVAGFFLITAIIGFCPLYSLLGIQTCSVHEKRNAH
jgi:hypothetical protein